MGLNCGASCAKYVLFAFNIIFFLGGAAVLGVGIWLRVDSGSFTTFLSQVDPDGQSVEVTNNIIGENLAYIHTIGYTLIGIGSFVFLVGFMGCCGACKEWRPLLVGYAICLIVIMCAEIGVGIAVGVYKDEVVGRMRTELQANVLNKYEYVLTSPSGDRIAPIPITNPSMPDTNRVSTNAMNGLQIALSCCGLDTYNDLITGPSGQKTPYGLLRSDAPVFCCKISDYKTLTVVDPVCLTTRTNENSHRQTGCITRVEGFVKQYAPIVIGVTVGIGLIELVGVFFAFCLCCSIGDKRKYR